MLLPLRKLISHLPPSVQRALRRSLMRVRVWRRRLTSEEYEYHILHQLVRPGDWALDIGANFGVYTARLSELVGPEGRVISMEPVVQTFDALNALVQELPYRNVTLLNVACFDNSCTLPMTIPRSGDGLENLYESALDARGGAGEGGQTALCLPVDALGLPKRIALAKIDTEGAELPVLRGMAKILERDKPVLIVEWNPEIETITGFLSQFGYKVASSSGQTRTPEGYVRQNYLFVAGSPQEV